MRLIRREGAIAGNKVTKKIAVEDVNGNKHILRATVVSVDPKHAVMKQEGASAQMLENQLESMGLAERIVRPPLNMAELASLQEASSDLAPTIDIMAVGIDGFGARLVPRSPDKEFAKKFEAEIKKERAWLQSLLDSPNADGSLVNLRKITREDLEGTGNAYWELIPGVVSDRYTSIEKVDVSTMYISTPDRQFTPRVVNYLDENFEIQKKTFYRRFRRFVQVVGNKKVWYKEFGDPRVINRENGEVVEKTKGFDKKKAANEIYHFKIYTPRNSPYGLPRFTGNIISIKGSRSAEETNILTQQNNHVPSMAIMVSGGALTDGSINRIREFVDTQIKQSSNYSKFLILEGESQSDGLSTPNNMKIEIKPLSEHQHKDELWQQYDKNNVAKLRRSFRMSPILVGSAENFDRATATTSEMLTEKYVFSPEREAFDEFFNMLIIHQGARFLKFKSNSPNVTDEMNLVNILSNAERTGGLTPRIARGILEQILNRELPGFDDATGFDPDVPFSLSLAKVMHEAGMANQAGSHASQGQTPKAGKGGKADDPVAKLDPLEKLEKLLGDEKMASKALKLLREAGLI